VMDRPWEFEPPVVVVLSGGNIDPLLMLRVLRHGLAAAGRYQAVHVRMPDRPGALAGLLSTLAETDANVLDVVHTRVDPRLRLDEVDVSVQIETRGTEHLDEVMARLRGVGYVITSG
jgi:threonine dehydratase